MLTLGFADEHFPFLAEVSKESVNVRAGPNTNFEKVDKLNKGSEVVVLGRSFEWYKIQPLSTTKAFIRSDYLKIKEGEDIGIVLGDNVNIRSSSNADAATLGEVKKGTLVKVVEQKSGWCQLEPVVGTAAWIHHDFLKEVSADVPQSLLIPVLQWPAQPSVQKASHISNVSKGVEVKEIIEEVSLQGVLQPLAEAVQEDVHYKIVIDNKSVYYIKDIPQLSDFANAVVTLDGTIISDPDKKLAYPLLHINKISLVL